MSTLGERHAHRAVLRSEGIRLEGLDRLRGLAIVLMVLDHVLLVWPSSVGADVRLGVTRAALPLFCVVAGSLTPSRPRRLALLVLVGVVMSAMRPEAVAGPDVLLALALALVVASHLPPCGPAWLAAAAVAVIQPTTWPAPTVAGYQVGTVVALVLLGQAIPRAALAEAGERLPDALAPVGRRPLLLYVAHLAVLLALVEVIATT